MNTNEVSQHIQELEKLRSQTRRFRLLTLLGIIVIVVSGVSAIINSVYSLAIAGAKQDAFVKHFGADLQQNILPEAQKIAGRSLERLKPAIDVELQRLNARAPEVANAAVKELDKMGNELPVRAEQILDQTVGTMLKKRENKLRQLYPGSFDKQVPLLLDNLEAEAHEQLAATGEKIFNPHLNSIQHILVSLETIRKTEPVVVHDKVSKDMDPWQMAYLFMDVFVHEFKDLSVPEPVKSKETQQ